MSLPPRFTRPFPDALDLDQEHPSLRQPLPANVSARLVYDFDSSVFKHRWFRPVARLNTLDRLAFLQGSITFDVDLFSFDQARWFVGLF
jgi:hypothetical protein